MAGRPPRLRVMMEELRPVASEWRVLGVMLELPQHTLRSIEYDSRGCDEALEKVLKLWVEIGRNVTWESLVAALNSPILANRALARTIESRHLGASGMRVKYTHAHVMLMTHYISLSCSLK